MNLIEYWSTRTFIVQKRSCETLQTASRGSKTLAINKNFSMLHILYMSSSYLDQTMYCVLQQNFLYASQLVSSSRVSFIHHKHDWKSTNLNFPSKQPNAIMKPSIFLTFYFHCNRNKSKRLQHVQILLKSYIMFGVYEIRSSNSQYLANKRKIYPCGKDGNNCSTIWRIAWLSFFAGEALWPFATVPKKRERILRVVKILESWNNKESTCTSTHASISITMLAIRKK